MATAPKNLNDPLAELPNFGNYSPVQQVVSGQQPAPGQTPNPLSQPTTSGGFGGTFDFTPSTNPTWAQFDASHRAEDTNAAAHQRLAAIYRQRFGKQPQPAPGSASPPTAAQPSSDTSSVAAPPTGQPSYLTGAAPTASDVVSSLGQLPTAPNSDLNIPNIPMPKQFPNVDLNQLYGPAQRSLDARRAAAQAAQDKAQADNMAFANYINGLTSSTSSQLGSTLSALNDQAQAARTGSLQGIDSLVQQALQSAGPGANNVDLGNLSGTTAGTQASAIAQAGQSAENALPAQQAGAYLQRAGVDQGAIDKAADRAQQLATQQSANQLLGQIGTDQYNLDTARAQAGLQNTQDIRQYILGANSANITRAYDAATLASKNYGISADMASKIAGNALTMTGTEWRDYYSTLTSSQQKAATAIFNTVHADARNSQNNATKLAGDKLAANSRVAAAAARGTASAKLGTAFTNGLNAADRAAGATPVSQYQGSQKTNVALSQVGEVAKTMQANGQSLTFAQAAPILQARWPDLWNDPNFQAKVKQIFGS